jgi:ATP-dependent Clp protease, protease subunit
MIPRPAATTPGYPEFPSRPDGPQFPSGPGQPGDPARPGRPGGPARPDYPEFPGGPGYPGPPRPGSYPPARPAQVWLDPAGWPGSVYDRLLAQRIVLASGHLDDEAATRLSAQLLTLDAEGDDPIRLELQGPTADLPAALTLMGVLDVVGVPVRARVSGQLRGLAALGLLAACPDRRAYPNAVLVLAEPRADFAGTATELAAREEQLRVLVDAVYLRVAEVTGREVDDLRADAGRGRSLTVDQAVAYGLLQGYAEPR